MLESYGSADTNELGVIKLLKSRFVLLAVAMMQEATMISFLISLSCAAYFCGRLQLNESAVTKPAQIRQLVSTD